MGGAMINIPINYVEKPRTELVGTSNYKQQSFHVFFTREEAEKYIYKNGGLLIHGTYAESTKEEWQVWPLEIDNKNLVSYSYEGD